MIAFIEGLGEMLTTALLILALGVSVILLIGSILDLVEGSRNKEKLKNEMWFMP